LYKGARLFIGGKIMKKIIGSVCVLFIIGLVTFIEPSVVFAADEYDVYAKIESFTWKELGHSYLS